MTVSSAKTGAERQRKYRANKFNRRVDEGGEVRLDMFISLSCKTKLDHLAKHYGVTNKELIETMIKEKDDEFFRSNPDLFK